MKNSSKSKPPRFLRLSWGAVVLFLFLSLAFPIFAFTSVGDKEFQVDNQTYTLSKKQSLSSIRAIAHIGAVVRSNILTKELKKRGRVITDADLNSAIMQYLIPKFSKSK